MFKKVVVSIIITTVVLSPINFGVFQGGQVQSAGMELIIQDTTWSGNIKKNKMVAIDNGAVLTIEKGTIVEFDGGNLDTFSSIGIMIGNGQIIAEGTKESPIIFKKSSDSDIFFFGFGNGNQAKQSFLRYVEIDEGGMNINRDDSNPGMTMETNSFLNKVLAQQPSSMGAVTIQNGGNLHIENSKITNSRYAGISINGGKAEIVNSNFDNNNDNLAVYSSLDENHKGDLLLKNNWYGSNEPMELLSPPKQCELEIKECKTPFEGEVIRGEVNIDTWKGNDIIIDPIIVVPGILGSANSVLGFLKIDPIWHKYDDLLESLRRNVYGLNYNMDESYTEMIYSFPYDWRKKNDITALLLKMKISEIIQSTKISKVDIVAHSMGGLVSRSYIQGNHYQDNIDQLITLGTPHKGSPKAYLRWEAGEGFFDTEGFLLRRHLQHEAEKNGYDELYEYIQEKVPSVRELLPDYDYLFDVGEDKPMPYHKDYPRNEFLENLNSVENISKLNSVNFVNIIGDNGNDDTISKIRVELTVDSFMNGKWKHGYPEDFTSKKTDRGLENNKGDETVPVFSAKGVLSNEAMEIESKHTNLPTKAQCKILKELAGIEEANCQYVNNWDIPNWLLFHVFSPIDIQIIAPDSKRIGKDFETGEILDEIEGAYYTGYNTDKEFITIPNPQVGEYKILTKGTGDGDYRIESTYIYEDDNNEAQEKQAVFRGTTETNGEKAYTAILEDDSIVDKNSNNEEESNSDSESTTPTVSQNQSSESSSNDEDNNDDDKKKKDNTKKQTSTNSQLSIVTTDDELNYKTYQEASTNTKQKEVRGEIDIQEEEINEGENSFKAFWVIIVIGMALVGGILFKFFKFKKIKS